MRHSILCLLCVGFHTLVVSAQEPAQSHAGHTHEGDDAQPGHFHRSQNRKDEKVVDYLWRKSDEAFHQGDYERAVGLHRAIVALDPTEVESFSVASWLLWSMGKSDDALEFLQRGLKANPENWEMWDAAGQQYGLMKRSSDALAAYSKSVQLVPKEENSQMLRRRLAHAAEKAGNLPLSVETWQGLVRDFPTEPVNKNNLARVQKLVEQPKASTQSTALPTTSTTATVVFLASIAAAFCLLPLRHKRD